jgi:hypothetical protein
MAAVARVGHSALTGRWEQRLDAARVTGSDPRGGCVAAKFVLLKGSTGKYRFNLVAPTAK